MVMRSLWTYKKISHKVPTNPVSLFEEEIFCCSLKKISSVSQKSGTVIATYKSRNITNSESLI